MVTLFAARVREAKLRNVFWVHKAACPTMKRAQLSIVKFPCDFILPADKGKLNGSLKN